MGTLCKYSEILPKDISATINAIFESWPQGSAVSDLPLFRIN